MEMDPSLKSGLPATVNMVSTIPPQLMMSSASSSQEDMMVTLVRTIWQEIQKILTQARQKFSHSRPSKTDGGFVRFKNARLTGLSANRNQN